jgi:hypothetical protein
MTIVRFIAGVIVGRGTRMEGRRTARLDVKRRAWLNKLLPFSKGFRSSTAAACSLHGADRTIPT